MMGSLNIQDNLTDLLKQAPEVKLSGKDKVIIFSDLHMGDGSRQDDFRKNASLFMHALEFYYFERGYSLVLNGDVEELQKFRFARIHKKWKKLYRIFHAFYDAGRLYRITGNHDYGLYFIKDDVFDGDLLSALKFSIHGNTIAVFHGHQASPAFEKYNNVFGFLLRYLANPLRIRNRSAAYDSRKRFSIERAVYQYAAENKIVSIIGHTHRPLFESLSRIDTLKFEIERLCREYLDAGPRLRRSIEKDIQYYKEELKEWTSKHKRDDFNPPLYNAHIVIPCLFNSGCVIGKRGITGIEIGAGTITLVHWFDKRRSRKYFKHYEHSPEPLKNTDFFRIVLKEDQLNYIFTRIKLLA